MTSLSLSARAIAGAVVVIACGPGARRINGGADTIRLALGDKVFHPFGDFLLHDVGTVEFLSSL